MKLFSGWFRKAAPAVSYGLADPALVELLGGLQATAARISVTPETALRATPVAAAVRAIADPIATIPLRLVRLGPGGTRTPAPDHPVAELLCGDWCGWLSSHEGRRQITTDALLRDVGGVGLVTRVRGLPQEIIRLPPGTVSVAYSPLGEPTWTLNDGTGSRILDARDIVHIASPFSHYPLPRSPLTLARETVALALAMEAHAARLMGDGARPGGVLERTAPTAPAARQAPEAERQAEARFGSTWGGLAGSGRTIMLPVGTKFVPLTFNSVDMQFLELRKFSVEEIARAFGVPPHRLYELGRATWSNIADMGREFVDYTLSPWLRTWEAALARALLSPEERLDFAIEFDTDDLTLPSLKDQAEAYGRLIAGRIVNPNEVRAWMSLAPYDGGDTFANPNTTPSAPADGGAEKDPAA